MKARPKSVFEDKKENECLSSLHAKYDVVRADKVSNNIVFTVSVLLKKQRTRRFKNSTYKHASFDKEETLVNHKSFILSCLLYIGYLNVT